MTREERLDYCRICFNRKMNPKVGLVCSLTDQKADFVNSCPDFNKDKQQEAHIFKEKMAAVGDDQIGDSINYKINKISGVIVFAIGLMITIISHELSGDLGFSIFAYGSLITGVVLYYKGAEQEKVVKETLIKMRSMNKTIKGN